MELAVYPAIPRYCTSTFFPLTNRWDIYKQTIQGQAKPFAILYVFLSVDQLNAFRRSKRWSKRHALRPLRPPLRILLPPMISPPFTRTIVPSDRGGSLRSKPCLSLKNPFSCSGQERRFWSRSWSITKPIRHLTNLLSRVKRGRDALMIDSLINCIRESMLRSLLQGKRRKEEARRKSRVLLESGITGRSQMPLVHAGRAHWPPLNLCTVHLLVVMENTFIYCEMQ